MTHVGFQNGEFRIPGRKLKGLAVVVEKHLVYQLVLPSMTPQGQRFPFGDDSARDLQ